MSALAAAVLALVGASAEFDPDQPAAWSLEHADLYGVEGHGDQAWAVGDWGTVLRSGDAGASWQSVPTPTREPLYDVSFADVRHGWAVGGRGVILRTTDGGASWAQQPAEWTDDFGERSPLDSHLFGVTAVSQVEAWAVGDYGVVLHTTDGERWQQVRIPEDAFGDDEGADRIYNAVHFPDPGNGWIAGEFATVLRTTDGGATWTGERSFEGTAGDAYLFDVFAIDGSRAAVVGLAGTVYVTADGGLTWERRRTGVPTALYGLSWHNPTGVTVGDRGQLASTHDFGRSWLDPERPPLFNWLHGVVQSGESRIFAVGERGVVIRSEDAGSRWELLRGEAPPPLAGVMTPEPGQMGAPGLGTQGQGTEP